jgi:hypothetical protein
MARYDKFDIVEAYYVYFVHNHMGQWSKEYKRLCHMSNYFRPGLFIKERGYLSLTDNGKEIHDNLNKRENAKYMENWRK